MAATGTAILDFGVWPGSAMASVDVVGQAGIFATSMVNATVSLAADTSEHSVDEHRVEHLRVAAGNVVAGTGFTIYGERLNSLTYGRFNIDWAWV